MLFGVDMTHPVEVIVAIIVAVVVLWLANKGRVLIDIVEEKAKHSLGSEAYFRIMTVVREAIKSAKMNGLLDDIKDNLVAIVEKLIVEVDDVLVAEGLDKYISAKRLSLLIVSMLEQELGVDLPELEFDGVAPEMAVAELDPNAFVELVQKIVDAALGGEKATPTA